MNLLFVSLWPVVLFTYRKWQLPETSAMSCGIASGERGPNHWSSEIHHIQHYSLDSWAELHAGRGALLFQNVPMVVAVSLGEGGFIFFLDTEKKRRSRLVSRVKQQCHPCVCIWATTLSVSHINLSQRRRCKTLWRTTSLLKCVKMCVLFLIEKHCGRGGDNSFVCLNTLDTFSLTKTRRLNEMCFVQITVTKDTVLISTSNLLIQGRFSFYKAFLSVKTVLPTPTG